MQNGLCIKCNTKNVYHSNAKGSQSGLKTDSGSPLLNIFKENRFIPDIDLLEMDYYVCQSCGYFVMFVRDLSKLAKLDNCDNWKKLEGV